MTKIEAKADQIRVALLTCGTNDAALLTFQFTKAFLDSAHPEDVERAIEAFLSSQQLTPLSQPQSPTATATTRAEQPVAAQAQDPHPSTISVGDTIDQVLAALGQPFQIIDLGSKKTYRYQQLQVVFVDGKVSDVQ